jgi:hypothetical protein
MDGCLLLSLDIYIDTQQQLQIQNDKPALTRSFMKVTRIKSALSPTCFVCGGFLWLTTGAIDCFWFLS